MRKRSPVTEIRSLKSDVRRLERAIGATKAELSERRSIGGMMSNICFNLAQSAKQEPQARVSMDECRKACDKIRRWDAPSVAAHA